MNKKISRGFSLLEIVIAMLILGLVVAGMTGLFISTNKLVIQAGHRLVALNYARQVAETLKVYVSADPNTPPNAGNAFTNNNFDAIGIPSSLTEGGITYNCNYTVTNNPQNATGLRQVTITVNWAES